MRQILVFFSFSALTVISVITFAKAQKKQDESMKMLGNMFVNVLESCIKGDPCEIFNKKCLKFLLGKTRGFSKGLMPDMTSLMAEAKSGGCDSLMKILMNSFMG